MESHKRTLATLHIIYGSLTLAVFILVNTIFRSISPFIVSEMDSEEKLIFSSVSYIVRIIALFLVLVVPLPSIVGGIALLNGKKWGLTVLLISGSLSLLSFPLGMALGAYTIWVFVHSTQQNKINDQNQG